MAAQRVRVEVPAALYEWAIDRSRVDREGLARRFPKLETWLASETSPTLKQLEAFARATHTPIGIFFLTEPPVDAVPIPDFRTIGDRTVVRPSADLLDTLYQCQQRQEWFQDYAQANRFDPVTFVASCRLDSAVADAAVHMREVLSFSIEERGSSWGAAFARLREHAEDAGVLVMVNGVVGSNTHRKLDPDEFRGFALVDPLAPLVFVNGADTRAAQIFTLAHELAHLWLGESALSDVALDVESTNVAERWCNQVAAELLVPLVELREQFDAGRDLTEELDRLARRFCASTLVVLRRVQEAGYLSWPAYRAAYTAERQRVLGPMGEGGSAGNFYNTQPVRVSKLFARSVIASTLEGHTLYRDALDMLGFKKISTFNELAGRLGVA